VPIITLLVAQLNDPSLGQIGVDFALKVLQWDSHTTVRLQLWDIAGASYIIIIIDYKDTRHSI
jgi:hypothetical protein